MMFTLQGYPPQSQLDVSDPLHKSFSQSLDGDDIS
jgi:hypothetical protein